MNTSLFTDLAKPKAAAPEGVQPAKTAERSARKNSQKAPEGSSFAKHLDGSAGKAKPKDAAPHAPAKRPTADQPAEVNKPVHKKAMPAKDNVADEVALSQGSEDAKKTLAAAAAAVANTAGNEAQSSDDSAVLEKIKSLFDEKDVLATSQVPLLALISGQLQGLSPKDIPNLTANNPLIKAVMAEQDVAGVLAQSKTVGEIFQLLGVGKEVYQGAADKGLNLNAMVTPQAVIAAAGVDVKRATTELQLLKDNLPIDGVSKYMLRAAKMRAQTRGVAPQMSPAQMQQAAAQLNGQAPNVPGQPQQPTAAVSTGNFNAVGLPGEQISGYETPYEQQQISGVDAMRGQEQASVMQQRGDANINGIRPVRPQAGISVQAPQQASVDPMQAMNQQLQGQQVTVQNFSSNAAPVNIQEQLLQSQIQGVNGQVAKPLQMPTEFHAPEKVVNTDAAMPIQSFGTLQTVAATSANVTNAAAASATATGTKVMSSLPLESQMERLLVEMNGSVQTEMPKFDQGSSQGDGSGSFENPEAKMMYDLGTQLHRMESTKVAGNFSELLSTESSSNLINKVMERASLMVKEGGGSMKLDLGNAQIGKLEVALDVQSNKVDLKILAGSDHVRELINQDLPKLREALSAQDLNLAEVEVGVGDGSPWNGHNPEGFANSRENIEQQGNWQQGSNKMQRIANDYQQSTMTPQAMRRLAENHNGQVQVWA